MSSHSKSELETYNCLSIKITTATFAQPRSYFLTAQCIHKNSDINDTSNLSAAKYRTEASEQTKNPKFNCKPFFIKFPNDIELTHILDENKILFEAYVVVSKEENSTNKKEVKLMGENILILSEHKEKLLNNETINAVITLEGLLKIEQTEKRVPVGQTSVMIKLELLSQSISKTESLQSKDQSSQSIKSKDTSQSKHKEIQQPQQQQQQSIAKSKSQSKIKSKSLLQLHPQSKSKLRSRSKSKSKSQSKSKIKSKSGSLAHSMHTYTVKTPPLVQWPAIKHANSIMIQINRWWSTNIDSWPESFIHLMHRTCGEAVTAAQQTKSKCLNFYEVLELPLDNVNISEHETEFAPFIFKLVDESSREIIESFALPSTCLSVLNQYNLLFSFGNEGNINLECCIWFEPNRNSMLNILKENSSMIIAQISLNEIIGFDEKYTYSCFVEIINIKESNSNNNNNDCINPIKIDFNKGSSAFDWDYINNISNKQKRCWLHFNPQNCCNLQTLYLFCLKDIISTNQYQIIIKIYKDSTHKNTLIGYTNIPIRNSTYKQQQYKINLIDYSSKSIILDKQINFNFKLLKHQSAIDFMRYSTPKHDHNNSTSFELSLSTDSRIKLLEDVAAYPEVINSEIYQSIKSQLITHPPRLSSNNEDKIKPTKRFFEAIEKELNSKQKMIEKLELDKDDKFEEIRILGKEVVRLREELLRIKKINSKLTIRLQNIRDIETSNFAQLDKLSINKLKSMLKKYANGHKTEKHRRQHLEKTLEKLLIKLKGAKQIHYKLVKIQNAAKEQSLFIRKLQKKQNEISEYHLTIVSQEQVIEKLEEMLSWAHDTIKSLQTKLESGNVVSNRERELENEVISLQQENEELRKQINLQKKENLYQNNENLLKLKNELKAAGYRNDGLQLKLETGAEQFGKQIGELKLKIKELKEENTSDIDNDNDADDTSDIDLSNLSDLLDSISTDATFNEQK